MQVLSSTVHYFTLQDYTIQQRNCVCVLFQCVLDLCQRFFSLQNQFILALYSQRYTHPDALNAQGSFSKDKRKYLFLLKAINHRSGARCPEVCERLTIDWIGNRVSTATLIPSHQRSAISFFPHHVLTSPLPQ